MISAALLLLTNSLMLTLRMSGTAGTFPKPLSAADEKKYLELCAAGDLDAREVLIERNLRLVAHIIKKYYTKTRDREDLISIGTIGLIKGISSYRSDRGVRLATYAARCIENEILMYFRSQKKTAGEVSLSESIETDKDGNTLSLMDVVSVDDTMLDDLSSRELQAQLRKAISDTLTTREAEIIGKRYGIGCAVPKTQREIAEELGISRSYVSRIEKKALEKLEEAMRGSES